MRQAEHDWEDLFANIKDHYKKKTEPTSKEMLIIAHKWQSLIDAFTGGIKDTENRLGMYYQENPNAWQAFIGISGEEMNYFQKSLDSIKS